MQKLFPFRPDFRFPDGVNFHLDNFVSVAELLPTLQAVVTFLHAHTAAKTLHFTEDWLQHDGELFHRAIGDFPKLSQMIADADALRDFMPDDFNVRVGVASEDYVWYLRFFVDEDLEGDFDVTVPEELAQSLRPVLRELHGEHLQEEEASVYYERITDRG